MTDWDTVICGALADAALSIQRLEGQTDVGELAHLQPALLAALRARLGERVVTGLNGVALPDWDPLPGGIDVAIDANVPTVGIELKCYKLDETIWDIFKMSALRRLPGVEATYVIAAAPALRFESTSAGAALFNTPAGQIEVWDTTQFFKKWFKAWGNLLNGGSGRPTRVARNITLERVCVHEIPGFAEWELRVLRIENSGSGGWLVFGEFGWPCRIDS